VQIHGQVTVTVGSARDRIDQPGLRFQVRGQVRQCTL
jgi:hypothetical protein